jgi:hypothetical protein
MAKNDLLKRLEEANRKKNTQHVELKGVDYVKIKGDKGDKGDKGEDGKTIMGPRGLKGERGPRGKRGNPGKTGPQGKPGQDGKDGEDFSPNLYDMAINTINVAETLEGDARIDAKAIKNIDKQIDVSKFKIRKSQILDIDSNWPKNPYEYAGGSGATFLKSLRDVDLSGLSKNSDGKYILGGGGGTSTTDFSDNQFDIFNVTDNTKVFNFDASGITTGTTRTYAAPDADGTLALTSDVPSTTDNLTEGSTNLYSQWVAATGGINYAGGNVGIGTNTPNSALDVADGAISFDSSFSGSNTIQGNVSGDFLIQSRIDSLKFRAGLNDANKRDLQFYTGDTERLNIDRNGVWTIDSGTGLTLGDNQRLRLTRADGRRYFNVSVVSDNPSEVRFGSQNTVNSFNSSSMTFYTTTSGGVDYAERMRIHTNGNVGIGTNTPVEMLDVVGNVEITGTAITMNLPDDTANAGFIAENSDGFVKFYNGTGTVNDFWPVMEGLVGSSGKSFKFSGLTTPTDDAGTTPVMDFHIRQNDNTPVVNRPHSKWTNYTDELMRLDIDGNLGIGTNGPTELLDIDGDSIRLRQSLTPASASATGTQGQIAWDSNYIYVCAATNTWVRASLNTW